ncbi:Glucose-1-phosphate thymidylyltransferase [Prochlorococcus marinus str. MIT 9321]|uniref:Glucose-1-phosphate thymidylyltransferase n=1 Tax=Prochlorococcus marinus str. MIT 9401 TaxID=167551 RepID=A0A0A2BD80_PROMR|nr:glucose-1-phosphate thymidylyltransferase RfbA [Prochlorococcus marinus]KGG02887.1 Glucose-1-phosphate thymidylyltransferase [Prochlorococcus marinus str. MIT 9321]KGG10544.1 Glucose-1-phosphate thymidylyltransferase [Prochlorococcus marinus str. MIT 9401]
MKGIILAGGKGSRLAPLTDTFSKQLLPVYDKPMIYYPLSTLMLMGIKEILIITTKRDEILFKNLFGDGGNLGIKLSYEVQEEANGIPQAFILAEKFIKNSKVALILGDNIFYGHDLTNQLIASTKNKSEATIFAYRVLDPSRFGIINLDQSNRPLSIEEKPKSSKSDFAITGLYIYESNVIEYVKQLKLSNRGELEITDLNNIYLDQKKLKVEILGRGIAWLDTGTFDSLQDASLFIKTIEMRQGLKIGCPEEIAWRLNYISDIEFKNVANKYLNSPYGDYLIKILNEPENK